MGKNACILHIQQGVDIKNTQGTPTAQQQNNQITQIKNGQRTGIGFFSPKNTYKWPTGI